MGIQVDTAIFAASTPTPPLQSEFSFRAEDLCPAPPPAETHLTAPDPASPPDGEYYPFAPHSGYKLVADARYKRGYVYIVKRKVTTSGIEPETSCIHGQVGLSKRLRDPDHIRMAYHVTI